MKCIQVSVFGGPESLELVDVVRTVPSGHVEVQVAYAGVNFIDTYQREGQYPGVSLPMRLGVEVSGTVVNAAPDSVHKVGDAVAFAGLAQGAYAEYISVEPRVLVPVPPGVSLQQAAAVLEQGMTALMLADDVAAVAADKRVLIHAAATSGGVGARLAAFAGKRDWASAHRGKTLQKFSIVRVTVHTRHEVLGAFY
jgi:NADPH:quinone reductase